MMGVNKYKYAIEYYMFLVSSLSKFEKIITRNEGGDGWRLVNKYKTYGAACRALKQLNFNKNNGIGWRSHHIYTYPDKKYYKGVIYCIVHYYPDSDHNSWWHNHTKNK